MKKPKLGIFSKQLELLLMVVYGETINDRYEITRPQFHTDIIDYDENDIVIYDLPDSEQLIAWSNNKCKKIYLDSSGEYYAHPIYNPIDERKNKIIYNWLSNPNHYFISQRHSNIVHERAYTNLHYLPFLYYSSKFKLYVKSKFELPNFSNQPYDFITFLGKEKFKFESRLKILKHVLDDELTSCKFKHDNLIGLVENIHLQKFGDPYDFSWNILQSFLGKINIIFETLSLDDFNTDIYSENISETFFNNEFFFTEKTLRCLTSPEPSILILNPIAIKYLKSINFQFPYDGFENYDDVKNYIQSIKKIGIDNWIKENKKYFIHNSNEIWNLIYKKENIITKILETNL